MAVKFFALVVSLTLTLSYCASQSGRAVPASSGSMSLDEAIAQAAAQLEAGLPARTEVALISVSSPSAPFSQYVLDGIEAALVRNGKLVVIDRANLDKVRA
ncbi:hypothetical protein FACS1894190_10190 [Spirochaetia bacterium]|nr:hypothetical protein FACS1894190_10190 [Spirochaetia bacterium]